MQAKSLTTCVAFFACYTIIGLLAQADDNKPGTCTYTFTVNEVSPICTSGSAVVTNLKKRVKKIDAQMADVKILVQNLLDEVDALKNTKGGQVGSSYVRWGSKACPSTATLVYDGYTGKANHNHGGGVNYQCLPRNPDFSPFVSAHGESGSYIYGTEYETRSSPLMPSSKQDHDVPCAVCQVTRSQTLMIPAKTSCPTGWTSEYTGFLMADYHGHRGSTFECVDSNMETLQGGSANRNGAVFYVVEARCGSLPCPPYREFFELSCVVCSK